MDISPEIIPSDMPLRAFIVGLMLGTLAGIFTGGLAAYSKFAAN